MSEQNANFEWELSKENVLPLRSGRDCSTLNVVLQPNNGDQQSKIKAEKYDFELELRTYTGDDPLDVWDRYIKWIEKSFPSTGVGGKFIDLLQRFLKEFHHDQRYTNDTRYVLWWIKFANICDDALEIFSYMFDKGLGTDLSCYYEAWAGCLEQVGNIQKANAIFQEGYKRIKEPPANLEARYQEFQARVARRSVSSDFEQQDEGQTEERTVLGQLKGVGKKQQVGTNRIGLAKQTTRGLGVRTQPLQTQNQGFEIYNEENNHPSLVPQQTGEWSTLPTRKQANRENSLQPSAWNKNKLPQRSGFTGSVGQPSFKVHVEPDDQLITPRKLPVIDDNVLSARKPSKTGSDPLDAIRNNSSQVLDQVPAYMKSKIYTGTDEFCFEELRGAKYRKDKLQKLKVEAENRKIEAEKEEIARMRQELNQYHISIKEEGKQILQTIQSQLQTSSTEAAMAPKAPARDRFRPVQSADNRRSITPGSLENSREQPVTMQLNFDEMTENIISRSNHHNNSQVTPNLSTHSASTTFSAGSRQRSGIPTPDSDSLYRKHGLTAPSPTVHTKEAFQVVMGMFNSSLHGDTHWAAPTEEENMDGVEAMDEAPAVAAPFKIFDEGSENKPVPTTSIPVYIDKENIVYQVPLESKTKNFKKKGLCEIQVENEMAQGIPKPTLPENHTEKDYRFEEQMDDLEADFTIASAGFSATARLASTPYNLSSDVNLLFAPPLSTIKNTDRPNTTIDSLQPIENSQNNTNTSFKPQPLVVQEKTFDVHMNTPSKAKLSPIMEGSTESGSDESKSQASSLASKLSTQSHTLHSSHITSRNTTQGLASISENHPAPCQRAALHFTLDDHDMESIASQASHLSLANPEASATSQSSSHAIPQPLSNSSDKFSVHVDQPVLNLENVCREMDTDAECRTTRLPSVQEDSFPVPPSTMEEATDQHIIDVSCYVPPDADEKTEAILLGAVTINPKNPFDKETINDILSNLEIPLNEDAQYIDCGGLPVPEMRANNFVDIGGETYQIVSKLAEGGFAKIFKVIFLNEEFLDDDLSVQMDVQILKVQKPACLWEFYICRELEKRLCNLQEPMDVSSSILFVKKGYFFHNGSCLLQTYYPQGTLLNLVNSVKKSTSLVLTDLEPFVAYVTIELLHLIEKLHKCQIIHGDIKPDNFLIQDIPLITPSNQKSQVFGTQTKVFKLIDFGQSIDMTKFPEGTVFVAKVDTDGFKCIEMQTDQPWTYQTDLFGVIGTIHVLIFGKYMNVYQSKGKWHAASSIPRKWNQALWKELFNSLLNVPSCDKLPDIAKLRTQFENYFMTDLLQKYNKVAKSVEYEVRSAKYRQTQSH